MQRESRPAGLPALPGLGPLNLWATRECVLAFVCLFALQTLAGLWGQGLYTTPPLFPALCPASVATFLRG